MTKPFPYQIQGVNRIADLDGRALLADEMGLGKSFQSLLYADLNHLARPMVVVCPASIKWNWQHECFIHIRKRAEVLEGMKPPRATRQRLMRTPPILIINYDIVHKWLRFLDKLDPKLVVIDEPHYIKNRKAKRTKAVKKLCSDVPHVVALGGTPITNRPSEFWEILHLLRPDIFDSRRHFLYTYCGPKKTDYGWEFKGATKTQELHELLKKHVMIRRLKKHVLKQLPPKRRILVPLGITDRKQYEAADKTFLKWLRGISPGRALRASHNQQMVKSGYQLRLVAELKLKSVKEWIDNFLENSKGKMIVVAIHKSIIAQLQDYYKDQCVVIHGKVRGRKRHQTILKFQKDKGIRLLIAQLGVTIGWNGTAANTIAFVEHGYVPAIDEQAIDRIHRIGQTKHCTAYFLYAQDTIEERLCKIKRSKIKMFHAVLDGGDVGEDYSAFDALIKELRHRDKQKRKAV